MQTNTLVARGADTQLGSSSVLAPPATNVDLWNPIITENYGHFTFVSRHHSPT